MFDLLELTQCIEDFKVARFGFLIDFITWVRSLVVVKFLAQAAYAGNIVVKLIEEEIKILALFFRIHKNGLAGNLTRFVGWRNGVCENFNGV